MRVNLPEGQWIDLREVSELNRDHQDDWAELSEKIRNAKEAARPPLPELDAANPAVMPDPADRPPVTLNRKDVRPLHDLALQWLVKETSFGYPLPWTTATSKLLALPSWNLVIDKLETASYFDDLNAIVPKEKTTGTGT